MRLAKRIEQLHTLGVAHGNISLECLLVANTTPTAKGVLIDLSRAPTNVAFHSPERARGGDISQADDGWAIALALYTGLTGRNPYEGGRPDEVRARIAAGPPPALPLAVGDPELQRTLARALASDPAARFPKVGALREALEARLPPPRVQFAPLDEEDDTDASQSLLDDDDRVETAMFKPRLPVGGGGSAANRPPARPAPRATPTPPTATPQSATMPIARPGQPAARLPRPPPEVTAARPAAPVTPAAPATPSGPSAFSRSGDVPMLDPALASMRIGDDEDEDEDENANTIIAKPSPAIAAIRASMRKSAVPREDRTSATRAPSPAGGEPRDLRATAPDRPANRSVDSVPDGEPPPYHLGIGAASGSPAAGAAPLPSGFSEPERLPIGMPPPPAHYDSAQAQLWQPQPRQPPPSAPPTHAEPSAAYARGQSAPQSMPGSGGYPAGPSPQPSVQQPYGHGPPGGQGYSGYGQPTGFEVPNGAAAYGFDPNANPAISGYSGGPGHSAGFPGGYGAQGPYAGQGVAADPTSMPTAFNGRARRNRTLVVAAITVVVLAGAAAVAMTVASRSPGGSAPSATSSKG